MIFRQLKPVFWKSGISLSSTRLIEKGHVVIIFSFAQMTPEEAAHVADELAKRLNVIPGVVENGLFVDVADAIVLGHPDGSADVVVL